MNKLVYAFHEGHKEMKSLLGGKGANLAEMMKIGLPVPPGFTITTECCIRYYDEGKKISDELQAQIRQYMRWIEETTGKGFGARRSPLLVSVRSGAAVSMPGMMDTILNLGLNDETIPGLIELTGNPRFAYDSYRRFIQMFGDVVLEIDKKEFDRILDAVKKNNGCRLDTELTAEHLQEIIAQYKALVQERTGMPFPQNPEQQLMLSIRAVFESWNNPRAIVYRNLHEMPHDLGTAVNVQCMVFGNMGDTSGTGVAFTRNPATGEKKLYGEFLINAQGEDVVAGIRTPKTIAELAQIMPDVYRQFVDAAETLERHYKDMQDIEFTIEKGRLFMLQTRNGKRTAMAAVNAAVDMVNEGLIDKQTALARIEPGMVDQLLHPAFDEQELATSRVIAHGIAASPGAASGQVCFTAEQAVAAKKKGRHVILVRQETSPEDIEGMVSAEGILTAHGGATSHAAVVARGMGKCCVAGCGDIQVDETHAVFRIGSEIYKEDDWISVDGKSGFVYAGKLKTREAELSGNFGVLMGWADEVRRLGVRANADTPKDAATAVRFGAEGIGLCRTEHMFFEESRIMHVRQMIVATDDEARQKALAMLLPCQREDFVGIFAAMHGLPVTIRLLDPPLHEFLPATHEEIAALAADLAVDIDALEGIVAGLREFNPMLGHRGCRLGITFPEIYAMQVRAIFEAAAICLQDKQVEVRPEIMIPLVGFEKELELLVAMVHDVAKQVMTEKAFAVDYKVGTMIEVPRAALLADKIARHAEFFSFGTNDLTQMTLGFSRDDSAKFIEAYKKKEIFDKDPFERLDQEGVGLLMKWAVDKGRDARPGIKMGICGEHGGEPASIDFCHRIGLEYVSCSPFRVPVARLAAAQAAPSVIVTPAWTVERRAATIAPP